MLPAKHLAKLVQLHTEMSQKRGRWHVLPQERPPSGSSCVSPVTPCLVSSVSLLPRAGHLRWLWPQTRSLSSLPLLYGHWLPYILYGNFWKIFEERRRLLYFSSFTGNGDILGSAHHFLAACPFCDFTGFAFQAKWYGIQAQGWPQGHCVTSLAICGRGSSSGSRNLVFLDHSLFHPSFMFQK